MQPPLLLIIFRIEVVFAFETTDSYSHVVDPIVEHLECLHSMFEVSEEFPILVNESITAFLRSHVSHAPKCFATIVISDPVVIAPLEVLYTVQPQP